MTTLVHRPKMSKTDGGVTHQQYIETTKTIYDAMNFEGMATVRS